MPKINGYDFVIGADPEFFVKEKGGKLVSAHGLIKGDKKNPRRVRNGAVQVDGMALEINIDPCNTEEQFVNRFDSVLGALQKMVPDHEFVFEPVAEFGKKYIDSQPAEAKILGCEPDYNAYTGKLNPIPDAGAGFRTAAGHIHIGWQPNDVENPALNEDHMTACRNLTRMLDVYIGLLGLHFEGVNKRRQLYGKAGAFRPKPYGMEYRTPGNWWVKSHVGRRFIWRNTLAAIHKTFDNDNYWKEVVLYNKDKHLAPEELINNYSGEDDNRFIGHWFRVSEHFDIGRPVPYKTIRQEFGEAA